MTSYQWAMRQVRLYREWRYDGLILTERRGEYLVLAQANGVVILRGTSWECYQYMRGAR